MTYVNQQGTISRKVEETLTRIDRLLSDRKELSDRLQQETEKSREEKNK